MSMKPPLISDSINSFMNDKCAIYAPAGITSATGFPIAPGISGALVTPVISPAVYGNLQKMSGNRTVQYKSYNADELFELFLPRKDSEGNLIVIDVNNVIVIDGIQYIPLASSRNLGDSSSLVIPLRKTRK